MNYNYCNELILKKKIKNLVLLSTYNKLQLQHMKRLAYVKLLRKT